MNPAFWVALATGSGGLIILLHSAWMSPIKEDIPPASFPLDPTETTIEIGNQALPHLRQGLNRETAKYIADIIQHIVGVDAVAITDTQSVLGWSGQSCPSHGPGSSLSQTTRDVLRDRQIRTLDTSLLGGYFECKLGVVVIAPLVSHNQSVGCVKLYVLNNRELPKPILRLAGGITQLLSILLELAEVDRQRSLATSARLEALQAQIRPHFLFNVLNTIIAFSRTDPDMARELLIELAAFFRRSLSHKGPTILLKDEIDYVQTYLKLEKARYGDKLKFRMRVQPTALTQSVPILIIQPLIENAVIHGVAPKEDPGTVSLRIHTREQDLVVFISDNGLGMTPDRRQDILKPGEGSGLGLGLSNVSERLIGHYGPKSSLKIRSFPGKGTAIRFTIPLHRPTPTDHF